MSKSQKILLFIYCAAVILIMIIFVPWGLKSNNGIERFFAYAPIWVSLKIPHSEMWIYTQVIETTRLLVEFVSLTFVTLILYLTMMRESK
jgi:hypothetical protein